MKVTKGQIILMLLLGLLGCSSPDVELQKKLYNFLTKLESSHKEEYYKINLDSLTDFDWDKCYIFHADSYFDNATISRDTGIEFKGNTLKDGSRRLVFVDGKQIVSYVDIHLDDYKVFFDGGEIQQGSRGDYPAQYYKSPANLIVFKKCNSDNWYFFPENKFASFREMIKTNKCN